MSGHNNHGNEHRHEKDADHHNHAASELHSENNIVQGNLAGDGHAPVSDVTERHEEAAAESHVDGGSYGADILERSGGGSIIPGGMAAFNEEIGADFAYGMPITGKDDAVQSRSSDRAEGDRSASGSAVGWVALVFAIASWLIWPMLMGITSVVLGFIAYRQGAKGLGSWSIALGLIAIVIRLIAAPLFAM
ncbi:hypothetical protein ACX93W_01300 [Paenibacillus sp. CAU 1782]